MKNDGFINKNMSVGRLIVTLMMLLIVVVGGTFAWLTYSSEQSALVLTIGDINDTQIKLSPYEVNATLAPSTTYTGGVYSEVEVSKGNNNSTSFALFYKINDLSMDLINAGLSYTIVNTQTNSVVKTGLFSELIDTDSSVPDEVIILDTNTDASLSANTSYYYRVYLWLDTKEGEQTDVQNTTLNVELNGSIGSTKISGNNKYGYTLTAIINDSVIDDTTTYSYQWYYNSNNSTTGGTAIAGETGSSYIVDEGLIGKYVYVVVKSSKGKTLSAITSDLISAREVTITSGSSERPYNGASMENGTCTADSQIVSGHTVICSMTGASTITEVGSVANVINSVVIKNADGVDVTNQYAITKVNGVLKINKKSVSVSWGSNNSFIYNGDAQAPTANVSTGVTGETMIVARTTEINVGNYTSTASCSTGGQVNCSNYELTNTTKTYTITPRVVTITAKDASKIYDETPLTNSNCEMTGHLDGHTATCTMTSASTITEVGSVANTIDTVLRSLIRIFTAGPAVSLKGSPTVSPTTAAL